MSDHPKARTVLIAVAAPAEARAVLAGLGADVAAAESPWRLHAAAPGFDVVVTGIGKANAAGAVGRLLDPQRHRAVVSMGVAGVLPGVADLGVGGTVVADACVFADEGVETGQEGEQGFIDCAALGFPLGPSPVQGSRVPVAPDLVRELREAVGECAVGSVATVSTCSGTDALAQRVRRRTGALAEAMEGAAVALVGARVGVMAGEVRVISNTTGDRTRQVWELRRALGVLERVAAGMRQVRG